MTRLRPLNVYVTETTAPMLANTSQHDEAGIFFHQLLKYPPSTYTEHRRPKTVLQNSIGKPYSVHKITYTFFSSITCSVVITLSATSEYLKVTNPNPLGFCVFGLYIIQHSTTSPYCWKCSRKVSKNDHHTFALAIWPFLAAPWLFKKQNLS